MIYHLQKAPFKAYAGAVQGVYLMGKCLSTADCGTKDSGNCLPFRNHVVLAAHSIFITAVFLVASLGNGEGLK